MGKYVIVGGGLAGLLASIMLATKNHEVVLIEKEPVCGGLLKSTAHENGVRFDMGTHIPTESGIRELDQILFEGMTDTDKWESFDILKPANFFQGKLYEFNQLIYAPNLPESVYYRGLTELLHTEPFEVPVDNLKTYTEMNYGKTFSESIFAPIMKKLMGCDMEELHYDAHLLFGYARIIVAGGHASRELKKSPFYNAKISYDTFFEGVSPVKKYYSRDKNGVGTWVEQLVNQAINCGVKILNGKMVQRINLDNKVVTNVELNDEQVIQCDRLIWTISPYVLLKSAGKTYSGELPKFRTMTLHHYVFDRPFQTRNYFVYCNDASYTSFRITLYPNITESEVRPPYNCTVEVLSDPIDNLDELNQLIHSELIDLGIVSSEASIMYAKAEKVNEGFPVYTNSFVHQLKEMRALAIDNFNNVELLGKGNGSVFFMNEVLTEVYHRINQLMDEVGDR